MAFSALAAGVHALAQHEAFESDQGQAGAWGRRVSKEADRYTSKARQKVMAKTSFDKLVEATGQAGSEYATQKRAARQGLRTRKSCPGAGSYNLTIDDL